jgi:hypothetical protein
MDSSTVRGAPAGAARERGATRESIHSCDRCGARMDAVHCKLVCPRCGYTRDCSDP